MKLPGYCTGCHRFRTIRVTGNALAIGFASGVCQGECDDCAMKPADLIRESERLFGKDLERRMGWLRTHPSRNASEALQRLRNGVAR